MQACRQHQRQTSKVENLLEVVVAVHTVTVAIFCRGLSRLNLCTVGTCALSGASGTLRPDLQEPGKLLRKNTASASSEQPGEATTRIVMRMTGMYQAANQPSPKSEMSGTCSSPPKHMMDRRAENTSNLHAMHGTCAWTAPLSLCQRYKRHERTAVPTPETAPLRPPIAPAIPLPLTPFPPPNPLALTGTRARTTSHLQPVAHSPVPGAARATRRKPAARRPQATMVSARARQPGYTSA